MKPIPAQELVASELESGRSVRVPVGLSEIKPEQAATPWPALGSAVSEEHEHVSRFEFTEHSEPEAHDFDLHDSLADPLARSLSTFRAPPVVASSAATGAPPGAALDQAALQLVKRFSMSGNGKAGTVRVELGGAFEGSTIVVNFDGAALSVEMEVGPGVDAGSVRAGIAERLRKRGLEVENLDVV